MRRKKPTSSKTAKSGKDENTKDLFEQESWSQNPVTMEKVLSVRALPRAPSLPALDDIALKLASVCGWQGAKIYTFEKEGNYNKGERQEEFVVIRSGVTFRVGLKDFMYESKKTESQQVFPPDLEEIPAFSVVEVMVAPSNTSGFKEGYGFHVSRIRPCGFTLYSLQNPLGLSLLPATYEESVVRGEKDAQVRGPFRGLAACDLSGLCRTSRACERRWTRRIPASSGAALRARTS